MRMKSGRCGIVAALLMSVAVPVLAASDIYMTIEGTQQGKFKGEVVRVKGAPSEQIRVLSLRQNMKAETRSGAVRRGSITIVKKVDASSPSLFQAMAKNELLRSVVFSSVGTDSDAGKVAEKIELKDAAIASLNTNGTAQTVTFTYQTIQITFVNGKVSATDDWTTPNQ